MKEDLKLFVYACNSADPLGIVEHLKGKNNLIVGVRLSDLTLAKFRNVYIVVQSKLDYFKQWSILDNSILDLLDSKFNCIDVTSTPKYDYELLKLDIGNDKFEKYEIKVLPLFKLPSMQSFKRARLNEESVIKYLNSLHKGIDLIEFYQVPVYQIINAINSDKKMARVNCYQKIDYLHNNKQLISTVKLDYEYLKSKGFDYIFGNSLMGFGVKKDKQIELVYSSFAEDRKGEFDTHPLMKLLNAGFYLPRN